MLSILKKGSIFIATRELLNMTDPAVFVVEKEHRRAMMNACCGHGVVDEAYVQFWHKERISGEQAIEWQRQHRDLKRIAKNELLEAVEKEGEG